MQYKQIVMQRLSEIKQKKILLVVAHPDDETLWFFQSIQKLKAYNEILVFCLTYAAASKRGEELSKTAEKLDFKVIFGHCEDTGIDHFLKPNELRQAFTKILSKHTFDLVITHPPHGGEKPHPHHIQLHFMAKELCQFYNIQFGFFSEQKLLDLTTKKRLFHFNMNNKKYVCNRITQGFLQISNKKGIFFYYLKSIFSIILNYHKYNGFEATVDLNDKHSALANFESQQEVLKSYNTFYKKSEFLYVEQISSRHHTLIKALRLYLFFSCYLQRKYNLF